MKNFKKLSILTIVLAIGIFFTGCTNGELQVYNAFLKSQEITSLESETDISFNLEGEGLSEENQFVLDEMGTMLNDFKMTMKQKTLGNEDGTIATSQVDAIMDMAGIKTDFSIWSHVDVSKDKPEMTQIMKMPKLLMNMAGEDYAHKEYILNDFNQVFSEDDGVNYDELMEWSKEVQPKIVDLLSNYVKNFDSEIKMVQSKGLRAVDRQLLDIYELRLDDKSFKDLIRITGNDFMENEDMKELMVEYFDMVFSMIEGQNPGEAEEMAQELKELKNSLPEMKNKFNKFMDKMDKIQVLGEEGIVVEYGIDREGYLVTEDASMNFILDLGLLGEEGAVKLEVKTSTRNFNINKDMEIVLPKLTEKNSFTMKEFQEKQIEEMERQMEELDRQMEEMEKMEEVEEEKVN